MTEDQLRELLRDLRDEPAPADSLARVRMRVAERTAARRKRWWIPVFALAAAAVLALLYWPRAPRSEQPVIAAAPATSGIASETQPSAFVGVHRRPKRLVQRPAVASIRIETADPDVVLILLTDGAED